MADEPKDYYDIIRDKISDPEIQKALDAFHARGVEEQRQARENAAPQEAPQEEPPRYEGVSPSLLDDLSRFETEPERRPAPGARRSPEEDFYPNNNRTKNPQQRHDVPSNGQRNPETTSPRIQDPAVFRSYMRTPARPSVYADETADDAYEAAYRAAMRKASGERSAGTRGKGGQFAVGLIVVLFAVFGLACAVFFAVRGVSGYKAARDEEKCAAYNARLVAVAAVDPDAFDDISAARMDDLIKVAVWQLIGSGVDPNRYVYANGELCLPQADVEAAYTACFGSQLPISHRTVEGYGYTAKYSEEEAAYYVPMTTLEPIYTPKVVSVETKGGATVVTCGMISSGMWKQDAATGDITPPDPDKYVRITFRTVSGAEYVSSLQSLGLPETAIPSGVPAGQTPQPDAPVTESPVETTTEKQIVITWD